MSLIGVDKGRSANTLLSNNWVGLVDAVSFGRLYIANPDLVERFKRGGPFNEMDKRTIYGGEGAAGYCDYPMLSGDA